MLHVRLSAALRCTSILLLAASLLACGAEDAGDARTPSVDAAGFGTAAPDPPGRDGQVVTLYDHGLGVARSRMTLPPGWTVAQDIAMNPQTGRHVRFRLDQIGPNGELVRTLAPVSYNAQFGPGFEQMWPAAVQRALQGALENVTLGGLRSSDHLARFPIERTPGQQRVEASLTATRAGQPYEGHVHIINQALPEAPHIGTFVAEILVAPPAHLAEALRLNLQVAHTVQVTPEYQAAWAEVDRRVLARMSAEHQQRMANNQAQFNAHQARMADQRATFDAANQAWRDQHFNTGWNTGSTTGSEPYTQNEKFLDSVIREQDAFDDPDSGERIRLDGHYDRTFTDGLGNYIRTDDPSFDPHSVQGSWQEVQPLQ